MVEWAESEAEVKNSQCVCVCVCVCVAGRTCQHRTRKQITCGFEVM